MRYWDSKKYREVSSTGNVLMGTLNPTNSLTHSPSTASKVAPRFRGIVPW